MIVTDQIKILDKKNMQNEAQYDLDRKAAKISALSSNNLDKHEYLTGEDLGLKPNTIEKGGKQLKELKNIDKSKTLKAIDEISKKILKQIY